MKISRCCAIAFGTAIVLAGVVVWQFYAHVDQSITLAYARTVSDEQAQVIEQLRGLASDELRGSSRAEVIRLLTAKSVDWFEKEEDNLVVGGSLVFAFEADRLIDIRSLFSDRE